MTEPTTLSAHQLADVALIAGRERDRVAKADYRRRTREEAAQAAMAPNPENYVTPQPPVSLKALRRWLAARHQDYARRRITPIELAECRRTATEIGGLHKAEAMKRGARAAERSAAAQDRLAELVASLKDGGVAAALLLSLRNGEGPRYHPMAGRPGALEPGS